MTDSPTARLLLARGATVDGANPATGGTAFHCACRNNQPECVEVLIRAGCDVGPKNIDGMTGRELAEAAGHVGVVALLRTVVAEQLRAAQAAAGPAPVLTVETSDGHVVTVTGAGAAACAAVYAMCTYYVLVNMCAHNS